MSKRRRLPKRDLLLFVRPARPSAGWPRDVVGGAKWAGVARHALGWFHDQPGSPMSRREVEWCQYALRGLVRWAVFCVRPFKPKT